MYLPLAAVVLFSSFVNNSTIYSYKHPDVKYCSNTISFDHVLNETWPDKWTTMLKEKDYCISTVNFTKTAKSIFAYKLNYVFYNGTDRTSDWFFGVTDKMNTKLYKEINSFENCKQSIFCSILPYLNVALIVVLALSAIFVSLFYLVHVCRMQ